MTRPRTPIRASGIELPPLGVGFSSVGGLFAAVDDDAGIRLVDASLAAGLDYFDVAPSYGYGQAERRAGEALAGRERSAFTISTKVGKLVQPTAERSPDEMFVGAPPGRAIFDFSRDAIARSLEESLERLQLAAVDIVYVHDPDDHLEAAVEETFPLLAEWRDQGVVRAIGFGMNAAEPLEWLVERTDPDLVLAANSYTLLDQSAARGLIPLCERRDVAVVIGGAFSSGILADPVNRPFYRYQPASPEILARVAALQHLTESHGVPLRVAALQFVARHPAVATILVGARNPEELHDALDALDAVTPDGLWDDLDALMDAVTEAPG
jgi:D-threo-aldose 1-dehydrogenase